MAQGQYRIAIFFDKNDLIVRQRMKQIGARYSSVSFPKNRTVNNSSLQTLNLNCPYDK